MTTALTPPIAVLEITPRCYAEVWRLALAQELGLVVEVPEGEPITHITTNLYQARKDLLAAEPHLDLMSFYITLPKDLPLLLIVRQQKTEPLE